ncbi:MAG: hypothetical protein FGM61_05670 [Sediminibacterium sp.]|nr:hypothetical protein [Sediminibacterium sp.]
MKKYLVPSLVGGIIIFLAQTLSWTVLNLHLPAQGYTPKQDTITQFLQQQLEKPGGYLIPSAPIGTSMDDQMKLAKNWEGQPQIMIQYHEGFSMSGSKMGMNMLRSLVSSILMVLLFCWIIQQFRTRSFFTYWVAALAMGLIVYIQIPYSTFIWYKIFDNRAFLIDCMAGWAACGAFVGWWYSRNNSKA